MQDTPSAVKKTPAPVSKVVARSNTGARPAARSAQAAPPKVTGPLLIAVIVFVIIGIGLTWFGAGRLINASTSRRWPTTQGRIETTSIKKVEERRHGMTLVRTRPTIHYEYEVNGKPYRGDRFSFDMSIAVDANGAALELAAKYPVGTTVAVHYKPGRPSRSVIEPGVTAGCAVWSSFFLLCGLMSLGVAGWLARGSLRFK